MRRRNRILLLSGISVVALTPVLIFYFVSYQFTLNPPTIYEKLGIQSAVVSDYPNNYTLVLIVDNTGTSDAKIIGVLINGISIESYWNLTYFNDIQVHSGQNLPSTPFPAGSKQVLTLSFVNIGALKAFFPLEALNVSVQTAAGNLYWTRVTAN